MKHDKLDPKPRRTLIASDFSLDVEPVASASPETEAPPLAASASIEVPKVVIEYRHRGLPWHIALPLMALVVLAALASYHRLMQWAYVHPQAGSSPVAAATPAKVEPVAEAKVEPPKAPPIAEPLSLSSHQIPPAVDVAKEAAPSELVGPPRFTEPNQDLFGARSVEKQSNWPPKSVFLDVASIPSPFDRPLNTLERALLFSTLEPPPKPGLFPDPASVPKAKPLESIAKPEVKVAENPAPSQPADAVKQPEPAKLPSKEEVNEAIKRESEQKKAVQAELKQFKEETPQRIRETWNVEVRAQRPKFLAELRTILREQKGEAGPAIEGLYKGYIHDVDPELRKETQRVLKRSSGRMSLQNKVKVLRSLGLPEPAVLDVICNEIHNRAHSTRCRCFAPQMYIMAARELLATELPPRARSKSEQDDDSAPAPLPNGTPARPASTGNRGGSRTQ